MLFLQAFPTTFPPFPKHMCVCVCVHTSLPQETHTHTHLQEKSAAKGSQRKESLLVESQTPSLEKEAIWKSTDFCQCY